MLFLCVFQDLDSIFQGNSAAIVVVDQYASDSIIFTFDLGKTGQDQLIFHACLVS